MANETASNNSTSAASSPREPIIIDLGKKKRRQVRKLRRGRPGRLADRVTEVLEEGIASKAIPADAQPVIVIIREKKKKTKMGKMWGLG